MRDSIRTTLDYPCVGLSQAKGTGGATGLFGARFALKRGSARSSHPPRPSKKQVRFPLIDSKGPKVTLSNERLYELIEFP